jgi:hypothetical protein
MQPVRAVVSTTVDTLQGMGQTLQAWWSSEKHPGTEKPEKEGRSLDHQDNSSTQSSPTTESSAKTSTSTTFAPADQQTTVRRLLTRLLAAGHVHVQRSDDVIQTRYWPWEIQQLKRSWILELGSLRFELARHGKVSSSRVPESSLPFTPPRVYVPQISFRILSRTSAKLFDQST